ncbi:MAG: transporter substrate-binding domain-containing protein [Nitratireductor sp.]
MLRWRPPLAVPDALEQRLAREPFVVRGGETHGAPHPIRDGGARQKNHGEASLLISSSQRFYPSRSRSRWTIGGAVHLTVSFKTTEKESSLLKTITKVVLAGIAGSLVAAAVQAGPLAERIEANEPIRLGFAAAPPWAYPGEDGSAQGFVNGITIDVLEKMGYTNIEPVLTDWSALIPSVNANRVDIVTGGMYVLPARCANMDFSDPIGAFGDVFLVPAGNPKGIETYQDLIDQGLTMVTPSGYNTVADAKAAGVPDGQVMVVPDSTAALAALRAGRADALATTILEANDMVAKVEGIEATDPDAFAGRKRQVVAIGFRPADDDFRQAFNKALAGYIGSDEMMETVAADGYVEAYLPGDASTQQACQAD